MCEIVRRSYLVSTTPTNFLTGGGRYYTFESENEIKIINP